MKAVGSGINIPILSVEEFCARFLPYDTYVAARLSRPFGSAVNPESGERDNRQYVSVDFVSDTNASRTGLSVLEGLRSGKAVVLTGEYGTGKSKFIEWLFEQLSAAAWNDLVFPVAIDLRRCWGLKDKYEILRRHLTDCGISDHQEAFVRAYSENRLLLLIDGFDELGVQVWTDNAVDLRRLRSDALEGVRELIARQKGGLIITGRDHYFDNEEEMVSSLGLASREIIYIRSKEEFDDQEIAEFLKVNSFDLEIPEWLPKKPLTCEFFLRVFGDIPEEQRSESANAQQFWDVMLSAVCDREARIHPSFDALTIRNVLIEVAATTRNKPENVGPITLTEIQQAFEAVVGHAPIDQATVLLQRLPGLGRTSADTQDRRFVDTYLLDGLRASHLLSMFDRQLVAVLSQDWLNPIGESGLLISGARISDFGLAEEATKIVRDNPNARNKTFLMDLISAVLAAGSTEFDFGGCFIDGGHSTTLNFSDASISRLTIENSLIDKLFINGAKVADVKIENCTIGNLEGVSSEAGIPKWLSGNEIATFSSIATTSRIRSARLSNPQKVLVTILRKTFFQKGAGRKEEALVRGLGKLVKPATTARILNKLKTEGLLREEKGDEGALYVPVRNKASIAGKMLSELTLSQDPIWKYVSEL